MNSKRSIFYLSTIGGFSMLIYWILRLGKHMEADRSFPAESKEAVYANGFIETISHNLQHPLAILLAQIIVIILTAKLFAWLCRKVGQPTVIGEIIAGIALGPSFLGHYFPDLSGSLFPVESLGNLQLLSQIGLLFFMFIIGMELDLKVLKHKAQDAIIISHASIIFPLALGAALAYLLYPSFSPASIDFLSFALFIGISMSITAFPVLARIVHERDLQKTKLGTIAITCAAADDITAWCLLAAVIAIVKAGSIFSSLDVIILAVIYVWFMVKLVRPFLKRIGDMHTTKENLSKPVVALFFLTLVISAYLTEIIGIHALFGAFLAGVIMPDNSKFRNIFTEKVEDVALVLLLPLFFVYTGLRTQIGLLNEPYHWQLTVLIIAVAVVGKFMGSTVAAKFVGQNWKDSLTIGALMNTRGLMELVVLNIGYDLGILTPEVFAMMVIMALFTTLMTSPTLDLIERLFKPKRSKVPTEISRFGKYNVLIAFGHPERSKQLLRLAHALTNRLNRSTTITAVHLTPTNDLHHYNASQYETESFAAILAESNRLEQTISTLFKATNHMESDIVDMANEGNYDLLLIGVGQSIFEGSTLGKIFGFTTRVINPEKIIYHMINRENPLESSIFSGSTQQILLRSRISVGVFIDRDFEQADRILIPVFTLADLKLMKYAQKFIRNSDAQIIVIDNKKLVSKSTETMEMIRAIEQIAPNHISRYENMEITNELLQAQSLLIVSTESWKELFTSKNIWLSQIPSTLLIKDRD